MLCSAWWSFEHHRIHVLFIAGAIVGSPFPCWGQKAEEAEVAAFTCAFSESLSHSMHSDCPWWYQGHPIAANSSPHSV